MNNKIEENFKYKEEKYYYLKIDILGEKFNLEM